MVFFPMLFLRPAMLLGTAGESLIPDFVTVTADVFLTPPSSGHLPYILLRKTQGERLRCIPLSPLLRFYTEHPAMLRDTAGGEGAYPSHYRLPVLSTPSVLAATSPIFCVTKHRGGVLKYLPDSEN